MPRAAPPRGTILDVVVLASASTAHVPGLGLATAGVADCMLCRAVADKVARLDEIIGQISKVCKKGTHLIAQFTDETLFGYWAFRAVLDEVLEGNE